MAEKATARGLAGLATTALVSIASLASIESATAQRRLSVTLGDQIYDNVLVSRDSFGCFDPLATMRFGEEGVGVSAQTRQDFSVGTCIAITSGAALEDVQEMSASDRVFWRARPEGGRISIYLPQWAADLGDANPGYDQPTVRALAQLKSVTVDLQARTEILLECEAAGNALSLRVNEFNARVEIYLEDKEQTKTGSRIADANIPQPVQRIQGTDIVSRRLQDESRSLAVERAELGGRCSRALPDDFPLNVDFVEYVQYRMN